MKILGIDPGATTGWCVYDAIPGAVLARGRFPGWQIDVPSSLYGGLEAVVVEKPEPHGATYPQVVECAYATGRLVAFLLGLCPRVHEVSRRVVRRTLQDAVHGTVRVKDDRTVWDALVMLHGEGCDRKPKVRKGEVVESGGCIGSVSSHERAALAVAVAYHLGAETEVVS